MISILFQSFDFRTNSLTIFNASFETGRENVKSDESERSKRCLGMSIRFINFMLTINLRPIRINCLALSLNCFDNAFSVEERFMVIQNFCLFAATIYV